MLYFIYKQVLIYSRMRSAHSRHLISAIRNGFKGIGANVNYLTSDTESTRVLRGSRMLVRELSISVKTLQYDLKKSDITKSCNRKLFFDTHAMVQLLEESGEISCLCFCNALANSSSVIHQNVLCPFRFRDSAGRGHCQYDGKYYKFKHGRYVR